MKRCMYSCALVGGGLVDQHLADVVGQVVAQRARDRVAFLVDQEGPGPALTRLTDGVPVGAQVVEIPLQFFGGPADTGRAHDRAHAVGYLQLLERLARGLAVLALDAPRDAARARIVGHQHQEPAGQRDEGRESGTLVAAFLLLHLHDQFLPFLEQVADVLAAARLRLLAEVVARDFLQRQEAVALAAVVDEGGLEAGFDASDAALVDIGLLLFARRNFDGEIVELLSVNEGDAQFFLLRRIDQHSFHLPLPRSVGPQHLGRGAPKSLWRCRCCVWASSRLPAALPAKARRLTSRIPP
jgi:hypothetical protein